MRMSEQQFADFQKRRRMADVSDPPFLPKAKPRGMNGLEQAYAKHLDLLKHCGEVVFWKYEPLRLRLANEAWYKPDFAVQYRGDRTVHLEETKGFWREAAKVRIKVAAELYPIFKFVAVKRSGGMWSYEEFA